MNYSSFDKRIGAPYSLAAAGWPAELFTSPYKMQPADLVRLWTLCIDKKLSFEKTANLVGGTSSREAPGGGAEGSGPGGFSGQHEASIGMGNV